MPDGSGACVVLAPDVLPLMLLTGRAEPPLAAFPAAPGTLVGTAATGITGVADSGGVTDGTDGWCSTATCTSSVLPGNSCKRKAIVHA
jgi:hypothetical protein